MGEFRDLVLLGQWCKRTGLDLIQILPVNDTGLDPSPYNAQSAFALNPIYIRLEEVPGADICSEEIREARVRFEAAGRLQYQNVRNFKLEMLRRIFRRNELAIARDEELRQWVLQNHWLKSYSEFVGPEGSGLFIAWVQFHLDRQLQSAALELDEMGVALKGDIPILLSEDSVDVHINPAFFDKRIRVGAPPDMFSIEGQNWRFPSFRWAEMAKDDFAWWRSRLEWASRFYHAFRIDHVLGFFRIWSIPENEKSASRGYYEPARRISAETLLSDAVLNESDVEELIESYAWSAPNQALLRRGTGDTPPHSRGLMRSRRLDYGRCSKSTGPGKKSCGGSTAENC